MKIPTHEEVRQHVTDGTTISQRRLLAYIAANEQKSRAVPQAVAALEDAQRVINTHIPNEQPLCVPGISLKIKAALAALKGA